MANLEIVLIATLALALLLSLAAHLRLRRKARLLDKIERWRSRLPLAPHPVPRERRYRYLKPVTLFAHRGLARYATENTGAAIELAARSGANGIEVDVRFTEDGVPILYHDKNLARLAGKDLTVKDLPWDRIRNLQVLPANRILRLEDFLVAFGGRFERFILDLKKLKAERDGQAKIEAVERLLRAHDALSRAILDISSLPLLKAASALGLEVTYRKPAIPLEEVRSLGIRRISIDAARARALREGPGWAGLEVMAICPPRPEDALWLFERGAHGVITDAVEEILDALEARGFIVAEGGAVPKKG